MLFFWNFVGSPWYNVVDWWRKVFSFLGDDTGDRPSLSRAYVLAIGIDDYQHLPKLRGAVADAHAVTDYLQTGMGVQSSRIHLLSNGAATKKSILTSLQELSAGDDIQAEDPLVIYFAGHGSMVGSPDEQRSDTGGLKTRVRMLCPQDFTPDMEDADDANGITHSTIRDCLEQVHKAKSNSITLILDCCYAASDDSEELRSGSYDLLASCGSRQLSMEVDNRGIFTTALLEVLHELGAHITPRELMNHLPYLDNQEPRYIGTHEQNTLFNHKLRKSNGTTASPRSRRRYRPYPSGPMSEDAFDSCEFPGLVNRRRHLQVGRAAGAQY